jgi:hypothetical protein
MRRIKRGMMMPDDGRGLCGEANPVVVFYGRVGHEQAADSVTHQRRSVEEWFKEKGLPLADAYIDTVPRTTLWTARPRAKALLRDCASRCPGTTVVATGDAAQAFGITELWPAIHLLARYGAQLWAPAFGGAADISSTRHRYVAEILGGVAAPGPKRPFLASPRRRSGYSGQQQGRSRSPQRRTRR